ncbi:tsukushi-like [Amblyomma americanum]
MGRFNAYLAFAAIALSTRLGIVVANCPSEASLQPCTCDHYGINCMRVQSTTELRRAFRSGTLATRDQKQLWIQKTPITAFPEDVLGSFRFSEVHIELNSNLSSFTLEALRNSSRLLDVLSLYGNALQTFQFGQLRYFPDLMVLNLGGNRLTRIPDNTFFSTNIKKLVLSGNPLTSIGARAFYSLHGLRELDLANTRLATLGSLSLSIPRGHEQLRVDLSGGQLMLIDRRAFEGSAPLVLDLSHNNLTALEQQPFEDLMHRMYTRSSRLNFLPLIAVKGNPFTCRGCSYEWLVRHSQNQAVQQIFHGFRCTDGRGLSSITASRIGCRRRSWPFGGSIG